MVNIQQYRMLTKVYVPHKRLQQSRTDIRLKHTVIPCVQK